MPGKPGSPEKKMLGLTPHTRGNPREARQVQAGKQDHKGETLFPSEPQDAETKDTRHL